jgi:hypothetical protein
MHYNTLYHLCQPPLPTGLQGNDMLHYVTCDQHSFPIVVLTSAC